MVAGGFEHGLEEADAHQWVQDAITKYFEAEGDLLSHVAERSHTNRLTLHLDRALSERHTELCRQGWKVDAEYNRVGATDTTKALPTLIAKLEQLALGMGWHPGRLLRDRSTTNVSPDFVLHRRQSGREVGNAVVCELKRRDEDVDDIAIDVGKLLAFRSDLHYTHAFMILLGGPDDTEVVSISDSMEAALSFLRQLHDRGA